jgi:small subunit ribosomal protein S16
MLSIRFSRVGSKKRPVFRIVVMPKHRDPWANSNEILGHYNPRSTPKEVVIKADRVKYWIGQGAQPSDSVWNLLVDQKIVEGEKRTATHLTKKRKVKMEQKVVDAKEKEEEKKAKAEEEKVAAAEAKKVEEEKPAVEETPAPEAEAPAEKVETPAEEAPATEAEAPAEEKTAEVEAPTEEAAK